MNLLPLAPAIALFAAFAVAALVAAQSRAHRLFWVAKPVATFSLAFVVGVPPDGKFDHLIIAGLLFSVGGDVALLGKGNRSLLLGVGFFLLAHTAYTAAFWVSGGAGPWRSPALLGPVLATVATVWLVRHLWAGIEARLRGAVVLYAVVITSMLGSGFFLLAGPLPKQAAFSATAGAVLFYLSDAMLAWGLFKARAPGTTETPTLSLSLYWVGQLGLALAARAL